ncbi:hypothetical protein B0H14DRAFT_2826106, partial [Mycena olivaceomarginata]
SNPTQKLSVSVTIKTSNSSPTGWLILSKQGEKFALALGLENNPKSFTIARDAMKNFVKKSLPPKVIKVERPKPKPLYRGAKTTTVNTADTPKPTAPPLDTDAPKSKSTPVVLLASMQGCPCPVNKPVSTPAPPPPSPSSGHEPAFTAHQLPTLTEFLAGVPGSGVHRRERSAGCGELKEEAQRSFIRNHLAESALEVEAIVAGLASCAKRVRR